MRRFVICLLLFVLPLQFALAGAVDTFEHAGDRHSEQSHTAGTDIQPDALDIDDDDNVSPVPSAAPQPDAVPVKRQLSLF